MRSYLRDQYSNDVVERRKASKAYLKNKSWSLIHNLENRGLKVLKRHMRDKRVKERNYRDLFD